MPIDSTSGYFAASSVEPVEHLLEQRGDVPAEMAVEFDDAVREAVDRDRACTRPSSMMPAMTRPPEAPMSIAATTRRVIGSAQEGGGDAGVDGDVEAGGVAELGRR